MTIALEFTDGVTPYDLTLEGSIYYGKVQLGETKKTAILLKNLDANRICRDVVIDAVAHPTDQMGPASETYDACKFCLTESGTFVKPLTGITLPAGGQIVIWLEWIVAAEAIPGYMRFAIKVEGAYDL
jgi:hypothetical protein